MITLLSRPWAFGLAWLGCFAMSPQLAGDEPPAAADEPAISLFDANPLFLSEIELPVAAEQLADLADAAAAGRPRSGAAADGVSLLLVRAAFKAAGEAEFSLTGDGPAGRLAKLSDLDAAPRTVATIPTKDGRHAAFAVYVPPEGFGRRHAGEKVFSRQVSVAVRFWRGKADRERGPPDAEHAATVEVVRPPAVLIHGLYHDPAIAWQTPPPKDIGTATMEQALAARGFRVFLVDYAATNGKSGSGPSSLQDNQQVVWSNKGGIRDALAAYRKLGYAATQADVVGHSMGGLLTRAYVKGKRLEAGDRRLEEEKKKKSDLQPPASSLQPSSWYLRPDNFRQGDVNRLITMCTPHQGSELVRLLLRLGDSAKKLDPKKGGDAEVLLRLFDLAYGVSTGAFTDQELFSPAIAALGPTPVPCHAIACTAAEEDFGGFNGVYRWNFLTMMLLSPPELLKALLEHPDIDQPGDAAKIVAFAAEHGHLKSGIVPKAVAALMGRAVAETSDDATRRQYDFGAGLFAATVFAGRPHDGAVAEPSALGGLKPPHVSTIPHVLHSFAPRYPAVQRRVVELLEGPDSNFAPHGFPALDRDQTGATTEPKR